MSLQHPSIFKYIGIFFSFTHRNAAKLERATFSSAAHHNQLPQRVHYNSLYDSSHLLAQHNCIMIFRRITAFAQFERAVFFFFFSLAKFTTVWLACWNREIKTAFSSIKVTPPNLECHLPISKVTFCHTGSAGSLCLSSLDATHSWHVKCKSSDFRMEL